MTEPDWRNMGDPLNDRLPPRRSGNVADAHDQVIQAQLGDDICDKRLDLEIVRWVATGPPDSYGRSINSVALAREVLALRLKLAWTEQISQDRGEENERLRLIVEQYHDVIQRTGVTTEIEKVTEQITCGHPTCGATWRDTEATGWLWYCSLPHGHDGHHRCIGATW